MTKEELDANYTPEGIAFDMCVRLNPRPGSRIIDPMCGDGRLLKQLRAMYWDRDLSFVGYDINIDAIMKCKEWARGKDYFEVMDILDWSNETYGCNYIIMNPCFHSPIVEHSIKCALNIFKKGMMYIPFDKPLGFNINALSFDCFELMAYEKDYLESVFDCEIKYRQGTVYWERADDPSIHPIN